MGWDETTVALDLGNEEENERKIVFLTVQYQVGRNKNTRGNPDYWSPSEPVDIHVIDGYWENNKKLTQKELRNIQYDYTEQIIDSIPTQS